MFDETSESVRLLKSCAVFKSSKICAHSIAVAQHTHVLEEFISWLLKQKGGPLNVTNSQADWCKIVHLMIKA